MSDHRHRPRKRFGQHFLIDRNIAQRIIAAVQPALDDALVEIGPGRGDLTQLMLPYLRELVVIELDRDLIVNLRSLSRPQHRLTVYQADALKFDYQQLLHDDKRIRLVGNLPYNISTPLLFHLLSFASGIEDMHFMLQKEVVDRLSAPVNSHSYSRLSIMVQYQCEVEHLFDVPASAFRPMPRVKSAMVRLRPRHTLPYKATDYTIFAEVVRHAFMHRRKTLYNCLKTLLHSDELEAMHINPQKRPAELSIAEYIMIANYLVTSNNLSL